MDDYRDLPLGEQNWRERRAYPIGGTRTVNHVRRERGHLYGNRPASDEEARRRLDEFRTDLFDFFAGA